MASISLPIKFVNIWNILKAIIPIKTDFIVLPQLENIDSDFFTLVFTLSILGDNVSNIPVKPLPAVFPAVSTFLRASPRARVSAVMPERLMPSAACL